MSDDHVYLSLVEGQDEESDDSQWAFGTGFSDPLHGVDTAVPEGVDAARLADCCLALGDDALISAQRMAEWCTDAPELEEEVALANIGLDLLGQARLLYSRTGQTDGSGRTEDAYAYFRDADDFRNVRLAELPNGDFAFSVVRLLVLSGRRLAQFSRLAGSPDPVLAAVAAKGVKELTYHRQYAADWAVRLGDGTEESARRTRDALDQVAPWLPDLFADRGTAALGADPRAVEDETRQMLRQVTEAAALPFPQPLQRGTEPPAGSARGSGRTEHLAPLLEQLQGVARAHPGASW